MINRKIIKKFCKKKNIMIDYQTEEQPFPEPQLPSSIEQHPLLSHPIH